MIRYTPASERTLSLFRTPFQQQLDPRNRWVRMAAVVPWDELDKVFFTRMSERYGRAIVDLRVVLGALIIKHLEGLLDEDTIDFIAENLYAQYFLGSPSFQTEPVFSATLFVEIRRRLGKQGAQELNDRLLHQAAKLRAIKHRAKPARGSTQEEQPPSLPPTTKPSDPAPEEPAPPQSPRGTLKLDATVAPQHVGYPTDTRLLHEARQYSEELIDALYYSSGHWSSKPRTYRRQAQQSYLAFAKKRKPQKRTVRRQRRKQLGYLRRRYCPSAPHAG